tara:strand:+ start:234 stop:758 length:525 start_codon:yes stop_codon:yes gene_type:complete
MSKNQQDKEIKEFKKNFFKKHGVDVCIFTPPEAEYQITLPTLCECTHNAFIKNNPSKMWIASMKSKTRVRPFIYYYQALCSIAWMDGHSKSSIGRHLMKNHASVINSIKMVENAFFCKDKEMINAFREILKQIVENVGTIPENLKRKIDSQPSSHLIWNETKSFSSYIEGGGEE